MLENKGFFPIMSIIVILAISCLVLGGAFVLTNTNLLKIKIDPASTKKESPYPSSFGLWNIVPNPKINSPRACTQEAKRCPDGSYASRTGPNCEFSPCPSQPPGLTTSSGVISGKISFPSEFIPKLTIYATRAETNAIKYSVVHTLENQNSYSISLEPGIYFLTAYVDNNPVLVGAYSQYVLCGAQSTCKDHSLVSVPIGLGQTVTNVDILDWYAPANAFPPRPQ